MKKHYQFTPPLEIIEQRLFGVTEGLIEAVERGETSQSINEAVRLSKEWAEYKKSENEIVSFQSALNEPFKATEAVPDRILDLIRRRVGTKSLSSYSTPEPGQIVSVEKIVTPRPGQLDAIMMSPLYVLLDGPSETPAIWYGWLASSETDYAGWWDFVLQEQDFPFDPDAAMVQVWNPVQLYLPMVSRVVAQLRPARLQAVRALAAEFLTGEVPNKVRSWPGRVANRETLSEILISTGSPLADGDQRHQYEDLYFRAAEAIREPARLAIAAMAEIPENRFREIFSQLISAAGRTAEILLPEPRIAVVMNDVSSPGAKDLNWPDIARISIIEISENGDGEMQIKATGSELLTIKVFKGTQIEERVDIEPGSQETIFWDKGSTSITLSTPIGRKLELPLRPIK